MKNKAHILVVDDAPLIRGLLSQVLEKYGYDVSTAENGQQAIECFIAQHPDLILMDADMPVLDGVKACAQLRKLPEAKHLPIVMVTSFAEKNWVDGAYLAGATDYVTKPVNWDVLRNRIRYILQAKQAEEALFQEKEKAQVTLASIEDGVITTDVKGAIDYLNPVAMKLTGWSTRRAKGNSLKEVFNLTHEQTQEPIIFPIQDCLTAGKAIVLSQGILLNNHHTQTQFAIESSAAPIRDRQGQVIGSVLVFHDVTENRKMTQALAYKATHDALTRLYNLQEFKNRLNHLFNLKPIPSGALFYMDLDQFKVVNDTCGHEAGDQLLRDVATILKGQIEEYYSQFTLARLGGDEFGLLLEQCSISDALQLGNILCAAIEKFQFYWQERGRQAVFSIGVSIGLVPIDPLLADPKQLLTQADAACYVAKNAGRNQVHLYQKQDEQQLDRDFQWISVLNDNLEQSKGLFLHHQPILALHIQTTEDQRYEILLRMDNHQGQLVPPSAFLSAAARYNLTSTLDLWTIRQLFTWLKNIPQFPSQLKLHINLNDASITDFSFVSTLLSLLTASPIPCQQLCFEFSELAVLTHFTDSQTLMLSLKQHGCQLALENFGAGLASFTHLKKLPIDFLKIDASLISNLLNDNLDSATVEAMNRLAHLMNLKTIADGVKNPAILEQLRNISLDYGQGDGLGKIQPLEEIVLQQWGNLVTR